MTKFFNALSVFTFLIVLGLCVHAWQQSQNFSWTQAKIKKLERPPLDDFMKDIDSKRVNHS